MEARKHLTREVLVDSAPELADAEGLEAVSTRRLAFSDIVRDAHHALPGSRLRRRLFWRYTLVWHQR